MAQAEGRPASSLPSRLPSLAQEPPPLLLPAPAPLLPSALPAARAQEKPQETTPLEGRAMASPLSEKRRLEKVQHIFERFDVNKDGRLSKVRGHEARGREVGAPRVGWRLPAGRARVLPPGAAKEVVHAKVHEEPRDGAEHEQYALDKEATGLDEQRPHLI